MIRTDTGGPNIGLSTAAAADVRRERPAQPSCEITALVHVKDKHAQSYDYVFQFAHEQPETPRQHSLAAREHMNIAACIKQVPDSAQIRFQSVTNTIKRPKRIK